MRKEGHEYKLDKETIIVSETDAKGRIVYANEDFCKIAKFTKDELIGKPHNIVRHPDMPKAAFADLWKTIQEGNIWKGIVKKKRYTPHYNKIWRVREDDIWKKPQRTDREDHGVPWTA